MNELSPFYLLFLAPIFQIIFSILRITKRISMPLGAIAFFSVVIGIISSIAAFNFSMHNFQASKIKCVDCGAMVAVSFLFIGPFITIVSTLFIGLIGYAIFNLKQDEESANEEIINNSLVLLIEIQCPFASMMAHY